MIELFPLFFALSWILFGLQSLLALVPLKNETLPAAIVGASLFFLGGMTACLLSLI